MYERRRRGKRVLVRRERQYQVSRSAIKLSALNHLLSPLKECVHVAFSPGACAYIAVEEANQLVDEERLGSCEVGRRGKQDAGGDSTAAATTKLTTVVVIIDILRLALHKPIGAVVNDAERPGFCAVGFSTVIGGQSGQAILYAFG